MKKALETLLQLRDEGVLAKFAIGGLRELVEQHHLQARWNVYARRYA